MERLTIISRTSALARIQARLVGEKIVENFPKIDLHYVTKTTNGDVAVQLSGIPSEADYMAQVLGEQTLLRCYLAHYQAA